jgi:hypothetical protein
LRTFGIASWNAIAREQRRAFSVLTSRAYRRNPDILPKSLLRIRDLANKLLAALTPGLAAADEALG